MHTFDTAGEIIYRLGDCAERTSTADRETGRVRGFAFVEMESEAEEDKAIEALDGAEWMDRQLKVNKAKPREDRSSFDGGGRNHRF